MDQKVGVDVIYRDLAKTFETVPLRKLSFKLREGFHISGLALQWLEEFFCGRFQRGRVGDNFLDQLPSCVILMMQLLLEILPRSCFFRNEKKKHFFQI